MANKIREISPGCGSVPRVHLCEASRSFVFHVRVTHLIPLVCFGTEVMRLALTRPEHSG